MSCSNNFKQIGLAIHNYHSAYKQLVKHGGGTNVPGNGPVGASRVPGTGHNRARLSIFVGLTPFFEQQAIWEQVRNPYVARQSDCVTPMPASPSTTFQAMGPNPDMSPGNHINTGCYVPWLTEIPTLRCPSDPGTGLPASGRSNYAACLGDSTHRMNGGVVARPGTTAALNQTIDVRISGRGLFFPGNQDPTPTKFRDILDGLANTIACGEINTDLGDRNITTHPVQRLGNSNGFRNSPATACPDPDPARPRFWSPNGTNNTNDAISNAQNGRGYRWAHGRPLSTGFFTIKPPNGIYCVDGGNANNTLNWTGFHPASSRHPGGAHVLMADGAVIFITDSIEAGDQTQPQVWDNMNATPAGSASPYGLWGALGTRASKEVIEEQLNQ
jgi:prepilin-type processing-associated H-X9-DG protein